MKSSQLSWSCLAQALLACSCLLLSFCNLTLVSEILSVQHQLSCQLLWLRLASILLASWAAHLWKSLLPRCTLRRSWHSLALSSALHVLQAVLRHSSFRQISRQAAEISVSIFGSSLRSSVLLCYWTPYILRLVFYEFKLSQRFELLDV